MRHCSDWNVMPLTTIESCVTALWGVQNPTEDVFPQTLLVWCLRKESYKVCVCEGGSDSAEEHLFCMVRPWVPFPGLLNIKAKKQKSSLRKTYCILLSYKGTEESSNKNLESFGFGGDMSIYLGCQEKRKMLCRWYLWTWKAKTGACRSSLDATVSIRPNGLSSLH